MANNQGHHNNTFNMETPPESSPRPAASPEFEFLPSNPSSLLSADELFLDGVLLPLDGLSLHSTQSHHHNPPNKHTHFQPRHRHKPRDYTTTELNINIWPFSRSRSAGAARPRAAIGHRKACSAPCSRSNSQGDSSKNVAPNCTTNNDGNGGKVWGLSSDRVRKLRRKMGVGEVKDGVVVMVAGDGGVFGSGNSKNVFNLRSIFSKKVY